MTVYRYFIKIALKHRIVILAYSGIFLLISILNSINTENKEVQFKETELDIGIIDNQNSELSKGLIDYLSEKNNIIETIEDEEYIKEQIFLEVADGVIIIPEDFDVNIINKKEAMNLYKDDRVIGTVYLKQQIDKYLLFVNAGYINGGFNLDNIKSALNQSINVNIVKNNKLENQAADIWFRNYFNFTSYIIIAVYITVIGLVMTEFNEEKIENRLKVSPKRLFNINKEIYLGQISLGVIITTIFILGSILIKGKHISEVDFSKYVINIIVFSFTTLCLTFLINNLTKDRFVINGISTVVSLGTSFISGVFVSQELLGKKVLNIAKFFPAYYFVRINETSINNFSDIRYDLMIQLMFGIVFLLIGLYFSKIKQKA